MGECLITRRGGLPNVFKYEDNDFFTQVLDKVSTDSDDFLNNHTMKSGNTTEYYYYDLDCEVGCTYMFLLSLQLTNYDNTVSKSFDVDILSGGDLLGTFSTISYSASTTAKRPKQGFIIFKATSSTVRVTWLDFYVWVGSYNGSLIKIGKI